jgi:hypothetical protein
MKRKNFHETYLLLGLYRDYGYFKDPRREKVHKKLKVRWRNDIDTDAFEEYFETWNMTKEDFDLE